jgi:DNA transformation protein
LSPVKQTKSARGYTITADMTRKAAKPGVTVGRGRLQSMRVSEGFRDYVLEQLAGVPRVHARAMFGGVGLYADDLFFGILAADTLYFKADERTRGRYAAAHMGAFKPYADRPMSMSYFQVPARVLEDPEELAMWAQDAIAVARGTTPWRASARRR